MGLFNLFGGADINKGIEEYKATLGAVLLDVRTAGEYRRGHIPGSRNVPLDIIDKVTGIVKDKQTPIFVHCLSGARSRQATARLAQMGYSKVKNIGGINAYRGRVE